MALPTAIKLDLSSIGTAVQGVGKGITDFWAAIRDKLTPEQQLEADKAQQAAQSAVDAAQAAINEKEAGSASLFVAGWRPFVAWVCGIALALHVLIEPLVEWGFTMAGHPIDLPKLDTNTVFTLLFSLLGLGSMRTVEKFNGVQGNH